MARAREDGRVSLVGLARRSRSALMVSTALQGVVVMVLAVPVRAQPAMNAHPMGGVVVGGSAAIGQSASNTTISQASQRAALEWRSFDVGSQQSVTFRQPGAQAIALNTVVGPNPSQIAGRITANGQVVLVNQSGVTFYKGSQVNTAGLMVSASGADSRAFMAGGDIAFDRAGNPNAQIVNNGNITVRGAGLASLVAPAVANRGAIDASLGTVVLAGAKTATLDLYGDKMVRLDVTGSVTRAPDGVQALVTNTGTIRADGGTVRLTGRAVDGIVTNLVSAGGKIEADSVGSRTGRITIDAVGGSIVIDATLSAAGKAAGTTGGKIELLATQNVAVGPAATINSSGAAGGGTIAIGTTLKRAAGGPSVTRARTAANVTIAQGATIAANATVNGDGGRVTVLSSRDTVMSGLIAAKGGPVGGNGGFVEVSGAGGYSLTGSVDVSAPLGKPGTILIDPYDLTIVTDGSGTGDGNVAATGLPVGNPGQTSLPITNSITVDAATLTGLTGGTLLIEASHDLTIGASGGATAIVFGNQVAGDSVTMLAGNNLAVNQPVSTGGGSLVLQAAVATDGTTAFANFNAAGALNVAATVGSKTTGNITLAGGTGAGGITLDANVVTQASGLVTLTSAGGIAQSAGAINAGTLTGSALGAATLTSTTNNVGTLGAFSTNGNLTLANNGNTGLLTIGGPVTGLNVSISNVATGTIAVAGSIGATLGGLTVAAGTGGIALNAGHILNAATVDLSATGGGVTQVASGTIAATLLKSTSGVVGPVNLLGTLNNIGTIGAFAVTVSKSSPIGDFVLVDSGNSASASLNLGTLTIAGPVSAAAGNIYLGGGANGTIGFASTGTLTSKAGGRIGLQTDTLVNLGTPGATGSVNAGTAGTFELAPVSATVPVALGTNGAAGTLALPGTVGINAGTLRIGAVTPPSGSLPNVNTPTIFAPSITIAGSFVAPTRLLELDAIGPVAQGSTLTAINAGTVNGTASSFTLLDPDNQIGVLAGGTVVGAATLIATGTTTGGANTLGTIAIVDKTPLTIGNGGTVNGTVVAGTVAARQGNVYIDDGANTLTFANAATVQAMPGGTNGSQAVVGLQADGLSNLGTTGATGVVDTGGGGLLEIAPNSGEVVTLGNAAGLSLTNLTGIVNTGTIRLGAVTEPNGAGTVTTATSIAVTGSFSAILASTTIAALDLEAKGAIAETGTGEIANLATLTASTNNTAGDIVLGNIGNSIGTLAGFDVPITGVANSAAVGAIIGSIDIGDTPGAAFGNTLTIPTLATIYAQNVSLTVDGSIAVGGSITALGSGATGGVLSLTATGGDLLVNGNPLLASQGTNAGAQGSVILTANTSAGAGGNISQSGGLINGGTVSLTADADFDQSAGTIAAVDAGGGVSVAAANLTQLSPGTIWSNGAMSLTAGGTAILKGLALSVSSATVTSHGSLQSDGLLGSDANLSLSDTTSFSQNGGTIGAGETLSITAPAVSQSSSAKAGADTVLITTSSGSVLPAFGSMTVVEGSTLTVGVGPNSGVPLGALTAPGAATATTPYFYLFKGQNGDSFNVPAPGTNVSLAGLVAEKIELDLTKDSALNAGTITESGQLAADQLIGTAGAVTLTNPGNYVSHLGDFTVTGTTGDFRLIDNGTLATGTLATTPWLTGPLSTTLSVAGTVQVQAGRTISIWTEGTVPLALDHSGTTFVLPDAPSSPDAPSIPIAHHGTDVISALGLLSAPAAIATSGTSVTITPGAIEMRTDTLLATPGLAPHDILVSAPDGLVAIAPSSTVGAASTISLGGTTGLALRQATLNTINTLGTPGTSSAGTDGTDTLLLGGLGLGGTVTASAIEINTGTFVSAGAPVIARNLVLAATGAVTQGPTNDLTVIALAGTAASFQLSGHNAIEEIGNVATRTIGGTKFVSSSAAQAEGLMATAGNIVVNDTAVPTQILSVVGAVSATGAIVAPSTVAAPGTIALFAPAIQIVNGPATLASGTIASAGSLTVSAAPIAADGTIVPALIQLETDQLSISSTGTATTLVSSPAGLVAIAPLTSGRKISIDATVATIAPGATVLSLGAADLNLISTLGTTGSPLFGTTPGPVGTKTLSLGQAYADNTGAVISGGSIAAGGIAINTTLSLTNVANTAALYATGDITEQPPPNPPNANPVGALLVNTVIGTSTTGNIYLNGTNFISNLGNVATQGTVTSSTGTIANLIAPAGNVLVRNGTDIAVVATVRAGTAVGTIDSNGAVSGGNFVEIDAVASGAATSGNLSVNTGSVVGNVLAGNVFLRAGNGATAGNVTIAGTVTALGAGEVDLAAGVAYSPGTLSGTTLQGTVVPGAAPGGVGGNISIGGGVNAGTAGLFAVGAIGEPGQITAGQVYGFANTATLFGSTGSAVATANSIGALGPFITKTGLVVRDGQGLLINGTVNDSSAAGVTVAVAPTTILGGVTSYTSQDLQIAAVVAAGTVIGTSVIGGTVVPTVVSTIAPLGAVNLEATGNVYETSISGVPSVTVGAGGGMSRAATSGGTPVVSGGTVFAGTLTSQAGVIPDTEATGNKAGSIPTTARTVSLAVDWFGSQNHVVNLGSVTSTGNFLLYNTQSLTVNGSVYAGAAPQSLTPAAAVSLASGFLGEFNTPVTSAANPFAEIDVLNAAAGNLTIADGAIVHAGLDDSVTGDVTLRAGNSGTLGLVTVGTTLGSAAGVFAANGGTVSIGAGYDPGLDAYVAPSGSITSGITIFGTIWGDAPGGTTITPASTVTLDAAGSIDELGSLAVIGATTLTGHAGYHANLGEVLAPSGSVYARGTVPSGNRIANLGTFQSDGTNDDPLGFLLRDGQSLTVTGPVTDFGASNSQGVSIAIVPGTGGTYTTGGLTLGNTVSAQTAVSLQATGAIEQTGGIVVANTLVVQAGAIPDTEMTGNTPGFVPGITITPAAGAMLTNANSVHYLGNASRGVTTTGDFTLNNVPDLTVAGTVVSTGGNVTVTDIGSVTNNSAILSKAANISVTSNTSFIDNPGVVQAAANASLDAAAWIANGGAVSAGDNATLTAGTSITTDGSVIAVNTVSLSAGLAGAPQISNAIDIGGLVSGSTVIATAAGTISETGTLVAGFLTGSAGGSVDLAGAGNPTANLVGTLGAFASGLTFDMSPGFLLRDGESLVESGPLTDAATGTTSAVTLSVVSAGTSLDGYGAANLTIAGPISVDPTFGTVRLEASGNVTQSPIASGNIVTAGTLVVQAGEIPDTELLGHTPGTPLANLPGPIASVSLPGPNRIVTVGSASAAGNLILTNDLALTVAGPVTVGGALLLNETGNLVFAQAAPVTASTVTINDAGNLTIAGVVKGTTGVTISDTGAMTLNGGIVSTGGTIALTDTDAIAFGGLLSAPGIYVNNGTVGTFAVNSGATIRTNGPARPNGALSKTQLDNLTPRDVNGVPNGLPGFYVETGSFTESGPMTVSGLSGATSIVRIDAYEGIQFGTPGLSARNTWLVIELLGNGAKSKGSINAEALDLYFSTQVQATGAALAGTVDGLGGEAAAGASHIVPSTGNSYQVNGCPISSINCVLLTTQGVPTASPLRDFVFGSIFNLTDEDDLLLPLVSDQRH